MRTITWFDAHREAGPYNCSLTCSMRLLQVLESAGDGTLTHPALLKDRVASPAGTTIAGLAEMEAAGVRGALIRAVAAASKRSGELG
jgi:pyrroline-5-carboxylate reductase